MRSSNGGTAPKSKNPFLARTKELDDALKDLGNKLDAPIVAPPGARQVASDIHPNNPFAAQLKKMDESSRKFDDALKGLSNALSSTSAKAAPTTHTVLTQLAQPQASSPVSTPSVSRSSSTSNSSSGGSPDNKTIVEIWGDHQERELAELQSQYDPEVYRLVNQPFQKMLNKLRGDYSKAKEDKKYS